VIAMMDQTTARRAARALTEGSAAHIYVAAPVPLGCWGGTEQGWDVFAYPEMRPLLDAERARLDRRP
jgi:hypothetical protein